MVEVELVRPESVARSTEYLDMLALARKYTRGSIVLAFVLMYIVMQIH